jgi:hypothetical protein
VVPVAVYVYTYCTAMACLVRLQCLDVQVTLPGVSSTAAQRSSIAIVPRRHPPPNFAKQNLPLPAPDPCSRSCIVRESWQQQQSLT